MKTVYWAFVIGLCIFQSVAIAAVDPAALATLSTGRIAMLDPTRGVFVISDGKILRQVPAFVGVNAIDFTAVPSASGDSFFVSLSGSLGPSPLPFTTLNQWSSSGRRIGQWTLVQMGARLAGVAIDTIGQVAYVSESSRGELYELDLKKPGGKLDLLVRVRNSEILGPIVFDGKRRRLIVADVASGRIFAVRLHDKKIDVLCDKGPIKEPAALALDGNTDRLYIADLTRRTVWVGTLTDRAIVVHPFAESEQFREPIGLTLSSNGSRVWVADRKNNELLQFDAGGKILSRTRL